MTTKPIYPQPRQAKRLAYIETPEMNGELYQRFDEQGNPYQAMRLHTAEKSYTFDLNNDPLEQGIFTLIDHILEARITLLKVDERMQDEINLNAAKPNAATDRED